MDCSTLEKLLENHEPIDLIDIRGEKEFFAMHIPGARSFPFAKLARPKVFQRPHPSGQPVYIVSDDQAKASLASGILRAGGCLNAMVVDGGMKAWVAQGLPVSRKLIFYDLPNLLSAIAVLLGTAGIAFAFAKFSVASAIFILAAALFVKASMLVRAPGSETRRLTVPKSDPVQWHALHETNEVPAC